MAAVAGSTIGIAGVQPAIGAYVQDALAPEANTNYIGVNVETAYDFNVLAQGDIGNDPDAAPQPDWIVPVNDNVATGGTAQWVKSASALVPGDAVSIGSGIATLDNATGTHDVFANVEPGQFFWAVTAAAT